MSRECATMLSCVGAAAEVQSAPLARMTVASATVSEIAETLHGLTLPPEPPPPRG